MHMGKGKFSFSINHTKTRCILLLLIFAFSLAFTGCEGRNASAPSNDSASSKSTDFSRESSDAATTDDSGLPDLYAKITETPLSDSLNPVHMDGGNPYLHCPRDFYAYKRRKHHQPVFV